MWPVPGMYTDFDIFTIRVGRDAAEAHGGAGGWLAGHADAPSLYEGVRRAVRSPSGGCATLLDEPSLRVTARWWHAKGGAALVTFAVEAAAASLAVRDVGLLQRRAARARMELWTGPFRRELELAYPDARFATSLFQVRCVPGFVVSRADDTLPAPALEDAATRDFVEAAFASVCLAESF